MGPDPAGPGGEGEGGGGGPGALRRHLRHLPSALPAIPRSCEALGIQCKMFAPIRPLVSTYYNNRDHRKILVVDGQVRLHRRRQPGGRVHQPAGPLRPLEGHRRHGRGGGGAQLYPDVPPDVERGQRTGRTTQRYLNATCPGGGAAGLYPALRGQPPGRGAGGRDGLYGYPQPGPAVCPHHDPLPDLGRQHDHRPDLRRQAGGGGAAHRCPHIPDKTYAFALAHTHYRELHGGGGADLRVHPRLRPRQDLCQRRRARRWWAPSTWTTGASLSTLSAPPYLCECARCGGRGGRTSRLLWPDEPAQVTLGGPAEDPPVAARLMAELLQAAGPPDVADCQPCNIKIG